MISKFTKSIFLCSTLIYLISPSLALAEDSNEIDSDSSEPAYPGEIKDTKNGKQVKLWSTKGPVPVSKAAQPFQNPKDQTIPNNVFLNVDGRQNSLTRPLIQNQQIQNQQLAPNDHLPKPQNQNQQIVPKEVLPLK